MCFSGWLRTTDAVDCEYMFAANLLADGVPGMSLGDTRESTPGLVDVGRRSPELFLRMPASRGCGCSSEAGVSVELLAG